MFEPAGQSHKAIGDTEFGPCLWRQSLMRRGRRVRDQALGIAEIVADAHEPERVLEAERGLLTALDVERHQRRARSHLPSGDLGLRMVRPARIDEARNLRMAGKRSRYRRRCVGL